ncbi:MAG: hypothetical protein HYS21_00100 [Deltaproteobacteria bacterium]|nr:hypothetical protein [Deltaproteobacteria bacterium]
MPERGVITIDLMDQKPEGKKIEKSGNRFLNEFNCLVEGTERLHKVIGEMNEHIKTMRNLRQRPFFMKRSGGN